MPRLMTVWCFAGELRKRFAFVASRMMKASAMYKGSARRICLGRRVPIGERDLPMVTAGNFCESNSRRSTVHEAQKICDNGSGAR